MNLLRTFTVSMLALGTLTVSACGGNSANGGAANTVLDSNASTCGDSKLIGSYRRNAIGGVERITLSSSCGGFSDYCAFTFTFSANRIASDSGGSTGTIGLNVAGSNGLDGCMANGNYPACNYTTSPTTGLTVTCGAQTYSFTRTQ